MGTTEGVVAWGRDVGATGGHVGWSGVLASLLLGTRSGCGIPFPHRTSGIGVRRNGLVVEGEGDELAAFVRRIESTMAGYIERTEIEREPAGGRFARFEIRT